MKCPYDNSEAVWCENKAVYGRKYGKPYMIWLCPTCGAYVGYHQNTKEPLGTMANKELRDWHIKAHAAIDPQWKHGKKSRKDVY